MAARTTAGIETWSTGLVEPERRLDYWIGAVCECFLEMDITTQVRSDFDCSVQRGQLDTIGINRVQGSAQHVYRRKASVARSTANYYYLLCKTDNEWTVTQNGHASRMRPMDLVLLDSRRCYEFNFPVNADTLSLELPIHWVESWISDPERRIGQRIDGRTGWGAALSAFACQLTPELATNRPLPARVLTDQLGAAGARVRQRDSGDARRAAGCRTTSGPDRPCHQAALRRTGTDGCGGRGGFAGLGADLAPLSQQGGPDVQRAAQRLPDGGGAADAERAAVRPHQHQWDRAAGRPVRSLPLHPSMPQVSRHDAGRVPAAALRAL